MYVYLIIIGVSMRHEAIQYAAINDDRVITPRPSFFGFLGAMEHASVEHHHFRSLGSQFQFKCATSIAQVLKRPAISSLVVGPELTLEA